MVMQFPVVVELPAYKDLKDIFAYIAKDSPLKAFKILEELENTIQKVGFFPYGHVVIFKLKGALIRQLVFKESFKILYTIKNKKVHILHVVRAEQLITIQKK